MNILLTILALLLPTHEINRRLALDFNKSLDDIMPYIQKYYPEADSAMIARWEQSGALEYQIIDGKKLYFKNAAQNLFRIDPEARKLKTERDGVEKAGRAYIVRQHIRQVLSCRKSKDYLYAPHKWEFSYRLYLPDNLPVNPGEEIKVWIPYPSSNTKRQQYIDTERTSTTADIHNDTPHASAFMTQPYQSNRPTVFETKYRFTSYAEYHPLPKHFKHREADRRSPTLAPYLQERAPHCIFTPEIKSLADSIIGNETRPYYKARLLFEAMRAIYPWASALEYSTIENITLYVIQNRHGDCGQVTLLYIALCRYVGIPARWQSGFMLHPGYENLHDWCEIYIEGMGWIPVDPSFGVQQWGETEKERYFYFGGIDAFRLTVNTDWGRELTPAKQYERSETVDFQRGEVETDKQNLYFDQWKWEFNAVNVW